MLGDDLRAVLPELRAHAESRMGAANGGSDAIVRRKMTNLPQSEATGSVDALWEIVHTGPMRLKGAVRNSSGTRRESVPGGDRQMATREGHWPHTVTHLIDGDLIEIAAGENAGTVWRIVEADFADQQTARRMPIEAATRPPEWPEEA